MNAPFLPAGGLILLDPAEASQAARMDAFLASQPAATPFHRPAWLAAVAKATDNRVFVLAAAGQTGDLTAVLPLVEVRSKLFGSALISSGFGVGGGVLAGTWGEVEALYAMAEAEAHRRGCATIELRGGPLPAGRPGWQVRHDTHLGYVVPLAANDEDQLLAIPRKQRAEIRKGLAAELTVSVGSAARDRRAHYAVYSESVRNLGTPVFPRALFNTVLDAFGGDADILTVWHAGRPVASVLSLYHRGAVMPYWGGGTRAARALRANDRMYFELMRHARERGCTSFDFGRSKANSGAADFKKNWGFDGQPLGYASWTAPGAKPRDADPTSRRHAKRIALWKKLPVPVANLIGPLIARGLG